MTLFPCSQMKMNYNQIHKLLEDCAEKIFDKVTKEGEYFHSLRFEVKLESDMGGFETVVVHRSKPGFFEDKVE